MCLIKNNISMRIKLKNADNKKGAEDQDKYETG